MLGLFTHTLKCQRRCQDCTVGKLKAGMLISYLFASLLCSKVLKCCRPLMGALSHGGANMCDSQALEPGLPGMQPAATCINHRSVLRAALAFFITSTSEPVADYWCADRCLQGTSVHCMQMMSLEGRYSHRLKLLQHSSLVSTKRCPHQQQWCCMDQVQTTIWCIVYKGGRNLPVKEVLASERSGVVWACHFRL